ncbi:MAG: hypothetical protein ACOCUT_04275 [bacterium]
MLFNSDNGENMVYSSVQNEKLTVFISPEIWNYSIYVQGLCVGCSKKSKKMNFNVPDTLILLGPFKTILGKLLKHKYLIPCICKDCILKTKNDEFFLLSDLGIIEKEWLGKQVEFDKSLVLSKEKYLILKTEESTKAYEDFVLDKLTNYFQNSFPTREKLFKEIGISDIFSNKLKALNKLYDKMYIVKKKDGKNQSKISKMIQEFASKAAEKYHQKDIWSVEVKSEISSMKTLYDNFEKTTSEINLPIRLSGLIVNNIEVPDYYPIIIVKKRAPVCVTRNMRISNIVNKYDLKRFKQCMYAYDDKNMGYYRL